MIIKMKRALAIFGNTALVFLAVTCSMGAVISAFWFTVDWSALLLFWAASALIASLLASFLRLGGVLILLAPALALILLRLPEIVEGAKWVLFFITNEYGKWLFVTVLFPGAEATEYAQTLFFAASGIVLSLLLSFAISVRRSTLLTVLFTLPIVALSFVVVFNISDIIYLIGLVAVILAMLISNGLSPDDFRKRALVIFPALGIAALLMGAAYVVSPPQNYTRSTLVRTLDYHIREFAARTGIAKMKTGIGWPALYGGAWRFQTYNVGVSSAGSREVTYESLLEVTTSEAGTFYLRGFAMLHFDGNTWTTNENDMRLRDEQLARMVPAYYAILYNELYKDSLSVRINMIIDRTGDETTRIEYKPYHSFPSDQISRQPQRQHEDFFYVEGSIVDLYRQIPSSFTSEIDLSAHSRAVSSKDTYLQIDDSTAEGLRQIASDAGIDQYAGRAAVVESVVEYFTSFGRYTLSPLIVPDDEDFALYFLTVSRQGYCIHYATTAALMLRALGVPARFTTGYVAHVKKSEVGQPVVITDANAHSWVEAYCENVGWLPIEVTPPGDGSDGPGMGFGAGLGRPEQTSDAPTGIVQDPDYDPYGQGAEWDIDGDGAEQAVSGLVSVWFIVGCVSGACIIALIARRAIVTRRRKRRFSMEDTNASVIFAWRYLSRLGRLKTWHTIWNEIEELANKACFSQHRLTEEERGKVISYTRDFAANIYDDRSLAGRFWVKYILGL